MARKNTVEVAINGKNNTGPALKGAGVNIKNLAKLALGAGGLAGVIYGARRAGAAIISFAKDASVLEGVERAFAGMSRAAGRAEGEMLDALKKGSQGLVESGKLMKSFNMAAQLVSKDFAQTLPSAMGMLAKASAATGESMDYMLDSLVRGVGRVSPMILDNLGIQVSLTRANADYAKSLNKSVEALTKTEQQSALAAEAMRLLAENTAAMPDLAGTLTFEMSRLNVTFAEFKNDTMRALNPAIGELMSLFNTLASSVLPWVNKALFELVPYIVVIIQWLNKLAGVATDAGESFMTNFVRRLKTTARMALEWGVNISVSLADGLIRGAVAAITAAMNFISGMLSRWLSPGSPPKVAPDLDKWGAAAMGEYLHGFSDAEFGILDSLQAPLRSALENLVATGKIAQEDVAPAFGRISQEIARMLSGFNETGEVGEGLFDLLRQTGGQYGDELVELAKRQIALATTLKQTKVAQDALTDSLKVEDEAQSQIEKLAKEYNDLLKAGASPAVLKAKKQEFVQARKALDQARDTRKEAEKAVKANEGAADPLAEQVRLQEQLLRQLTSLGQKSSPIAEAIADATAGAGGGLGDIAPIDIEKLMPDMSDLGQGMKDAIEEARSNLEGLISPLTEKWEGEWKPMIDGMKSKFGELTTDVVTAFRQKYPEAFLVTRSLLRGWAEGGVGGAIAVAQEWFAYFADDINLWWTNNVQPTLDLLVAWWNEKWPVVAAVVLTIWEVIKAAFKSAIDVIVEQAWPPLQEAFNTITEALGSMGITWGDVWNAIKQATVIVFSIIGALILALVGVFVGLVVGISKGVAVMVDVMMQWRENVMFVVQGVIQFFVGLYEFFAGLFTWDIPRLLNGLSNAFEGLITFFLGFITTTVGLFTGLAATLLAVIDGLVAGVVGFFTKLYDDLVGHSIILDLIDDIVAAFSIDWSAIGSGIIEGIKSGITNGIEAIKKAARAAAQAALDAAKRLLGIGSPSRAAALQIGMPIAAGIGVGMNRGISSPSFENQVNSATSAALNRAGAAMGNTYNFNETVNTRATDHNVMRNWQIAKSRAGVS